MSENDLLQLLQRPGVSATRIRIARWVESPAVQKWVVAVILANAVILGMETDAAIMAAAGSWLVALDKLCLVVFLAELTLKLFCYRGHFWRSGWNVFDFLVVGVAVIPGAGAWAVLRSLRVLRVLRLLTVVPGLRKVVAAFIHAIPGLSGVMAVMAIFFYTAGVLATRLFGATHDEWFGTLGRSLYSLFQIMTLESWSMGIVRPVMEVHPGAWLFFVPFIVVTSFAVLNLFIALIVNSMQSLQAETNQALRAEAVVAHDEREALLDRIEVLAREVRQLRESVRRD